MRVLARTMDDTGFTVGRAGAAEATLARAPWAPRVRTEARPPRLNRAWTIGLTVAALLHLAAIAPLALVRPMPRLDYSDEVVTLRLDLIPPPAPVVRERSRPAEAPAAETPPPPQKPPPFTPREAVSQVPPPADVEPLPAPPRPAPVQPRTEAPQPRAEAAAPAPAPAASTAPTPAFQRQVLAALDRAKRYPPAARARREQGTAVVAFTMSRSGRVLSAGVQASSGSPALDRAALETVRRARLPRVPAELSDPLRLVVPVEFAVK